MTPAAGRPWSGSPAAPGAPGALQAGFRARPSARRTPANRTPPSQTRPNESPASRWPACGPRAAPKPAGRHPAPRHPGARSPAARRRHHPVRRCRRARRSRRWPGPRRWRAARPGGSRRGVRAGTACGRGSRRPCCRGRWRPTRARLRPGSPLSQRSGQPRLPHRRYLVPCRIARSRASGQSPVVLPGAQAGIRPRRAARELFVRAG